MREIVVANGPEPQIDSALRWAGRLAESMDDDLRVVGAFAQVSDHLDQQLWDDAVRQRTVELEEAASSLTQRPVSIEVLDGHAHDALTAFVRDSSPDLVVVGQHGSRGAGGFSGDGMAHHLIHHVSVPVGVVNDGVAWSDSGPVVVGVDGSSANAGALEFAHDLAERCGRQVIAVFCYDPMADSFPHPGPGWKYPGETEVRHELAGVLADSVPLRLEAGHPVETLGDVAAELDALALVVATRGRGGFHGLVAGRVPTQLIRHASTALVVVPHAS